MTREHRETITFTPPLPSPPVPITPPHIFCGSNLLQRTGVTKRVFEQQLSECTILGRTENLDFSCSRTILKRTSDFMERDFSLSRV